MNDGANERSREIVDQMVEARVESGLNQIRLSEASGIRQANVSSLETGQHIPRLDTALRYLLPLGKTLAVVDRE